MIKSKINTYGFWVSPVIFIGISAFSIFGWFFSSNPNDTFPVLSVWGVLSIMLIPSILSAKLLLIDRNKKTIKVTRFFTREQTVYQFSDFDGFIDMIISPARGRPYKVLYLVQNKKSILEISSLIYSIFFELEESLKELKYWGERKFSYLKMLRFFFRSKVLVFCPTAVV